MANWYTKIKLAELPGDWYKDAKWHILRAMGAAYLSAKDPLQASKEDPGKIFITALGKNRNEADDKAGTLTKVFMFNVRPVRINLYYNGHRYTFSIRESDEGIKDNQVYAVDHAERMHVLAVSGTTPAEMLQSLEESVRAIDARLNPPDDADGGGNDGGPDSTPPWTDDPQWTEESDQELVPVRLRDKPEGQQLQEIERRRWQS